MQGLCIRQSPSDNTAALLGLQGQVPQWLADPQCLSQFYANMTAANTPTPTTHLMDTSTCQATYLLGLNQAQHFQAHSVAPKTLKQRHQNARELADWLHSTNTGRTLHTCLPEDVMVYLTTHWLPNHAGSTTNTHAKIAAPSSLAGVRSSLSTEFEQLGRNGDWNADTLKGNPMLSNQLRRLTKGYTAAKSQGYEPQAAEPIYSGKVETLLRHLLHQQQQSTGVDKLLLIRDGLTISMLWQSCFRGFNVGGLRLSNIKTPTNSPAIPFIIPELTLQAGAQLYLYPDVTKNRKGGHCTVTLSCDIMCFTTWLQLATAAHEEAKQPITNYIMRPLHKGTKTFAEKPMTSSAIWARFTLHLKNAGIYNGESVHSTRRGKMIESSTQHQASIEEVQEAAMIRSKPIALRYLDTTRATRGNQHM